MYGAEGGRGRQLDFLSEAGSGNEDLKRFFEDVELVGGTGSESGKKMIEERILVVEGLIEGIQTELGSILGADYKNEKKEDLSRLDAELLELKRKLPFKISAKEKERLNRQSNIEARKKSNRAEWWKR